MVSVDSRHRFSYDMNKMAPQVPRQVAKASPPSRPRAATQPVAARVRSGAQPAARAATVEPAAEKARLVPEPPPARAKPVAPARPMSFLGWLRALFESDDPERLKRRRLKELAAELRRSRPKLIDPGRGTVEPAFARFFWEIYRALAPAQLILKGAESSAALKMAIVELSLTEDQRALREHLAPDAIEERGRQGADADTIEEEVRRNAQNLAKDLAAEKAAEIDALYNRVLELLDMVRFDYYYLLQRFDPTIREREFSAPPKFQPVAAAEVADLLQDFLEILPGIDPDADWDRILGIVKEHRGVEVISHDAMRKMLQLVRDAQRTGVFLLMARFLVGNPDWKPMIRHHREKIVDAYLSKLKAEAETVARKVAASRKSEQVEQLIRDVFGTTPIKKMKNYSLTQGEDADRTMSGFEHVTAMNYLRAFLVDLLPGSIREAVDLLLIKGKWSTNQHSQALSEAYHQLLNLAGEVTKFDEDLAEDGDAGRRLKTIALRVEHDRKALVSLRGALQQVNERAHQMLSSAMPHLVAVARVLKLAYDDIGRPNPVHLLNCRELKPFGGDLRTLVATVYKRIYKFAQLMQTYR